MPVIKRIATVLGMAAVALAMVAGDMTTAQARPGGGFSTGSRGFKTYTPPPSTRTAPGTASPMQKSATPATQAAGAATAGAPSRFGGGMMGGLMGGLLGAGLLGLLFGGGLFGGLGSLAGIIGFALQALLIYWIAKMAFAYFSGRTAAASPGASYRQASLNDNERAGSAAGGTAGGTSAAGGPTTPIAVDAADYAAFERLLSVIQLSFGRGDVAALRTATTPEMLGYFGEQLDDNAKKGVRNELADPKLLSGDLAEAWTEPSGDYATVAMRYSLIDAMVENVGGRVVSGSKTAPQEVTEIWTFTRRRGGGANAWRLSAIQQVA